MTDDQHDQLPLAASPVTAQVDGDTAPPTGDTSPDGTESIEPTVRTSQRRRRGSRGGRNRRKPAGSGAVAVDGDDADDGDDGYDDSGSFESAAADSDTTPGPTVDDGRVPGMDPRSPGPR